MVRVFRRRGACLLHGLILLLATALLTTSLWAQETPAEPSQIPEEIFAMPVIVDGEELFRLRGSSALPADERAEFVSQKIIERAEASDSPTVNVSVQPSEFGRAIVADGHQVAVTTTADAEMEEIEIDVLADLHADAVREAILKYRQERTSDARIQSAKLALAWTALFIVSTFVLIRLRRWLPDRVAARVEKKFESVQEATKDIVRGRAIASIVRYAMRLAILALLFVNFYYYVSFVLLSFAETKPFAELLILYITDPIIGILDSFIGYLPNLITLGIIALITSYAIKGARVFFENLEAGTIQMENFQDQWIWPTFNIFRGAIIILALVLAFPYIPGSDSAAFQGVTILVGVMVSLGSNSVVSNLLSGLFVIYRRSTNVGDRIRIGEHTGDVVRIKLMETHLKSVKNELISIPNAQLLNSDVVNYSSMIDGRGLLIHTIVGIGYEEPQDKVEAMLIEAASRTRGLKKTPEPFVLRKALADYAVNYEINAFTTRGSQIPKIKSDLHAHILDVFHENGVQIMTPSYEADTPVPKIPSTPWDGKLAGPVKTP